MRRIRLVCLLVSVVLVFSLLLGACASGTPASEKEKPPAMLTISGGTIGGNGHQLAALWAGLLKKYANIDSTVISNETLYQSKVAAIGLADIGVSISISNYDVYTGTGPFALDKPATNLRILAYTFDLPNQIGVPVKSPIQSFSDLKGKSVSVRYHMSGAWYLFKQQAEALGYDIEKDMDMKYLSYAESTAAMISGSLDAWVAMGDPPHPTYAQTDLTFPMRLISLTEEEVNKIIAKFPAYAPFLIAADYYHMDKPALSVAFLGEEATTTDLSEDIAYKIVKGRFEDPELAGYYLSSAKRFIVEGFAREAVETIKVGVPYHAGAVRAYKELGWNVPAGRIPPEYKE